jgi:hypothetical protein
VTSKRNFFEYRKTFAFTAKQLSELRKKATAIENSDLPKDIKSQSLDALGYSQFEIVKKVIAKYKGKIKTKHHS